MGGVGKHPCAVIAGQIAAVVEHRHGGILRRDRAVDRVGELAVHRAGVPPDIGGIFRIQSCRQHGADAGRAYAGCRRADVGENAADSVAVQRHDLRDLCAEVFQIPVIIEAQLMEMRTQQGIVPADQHVPVLRVRDRHMLVEAGGNVHLRTHAHLPAHIGHQ